jgi:hypothetical protein
MPTMLLAGVGLAAGATFAAIPAVLPELRAVFSRGGSR